MINSPSDIVRLLRDAGYESSTGNLTPERVEQVIALQRLIQADPRSTLVQFLRIEREKEESRAQCLRAAEAATELEELMRKLLESDAVLCRLLIHGQLRVDSQLAQLAVDLANRANPVPVPPQILQAAEHRVALE